MLDMQFIRDNTSLVQTVADAKGISVEIAELIRLDARRLELLRCVEEIRYQRNSGSAKVAAYIQQGQRDAAETQKQAVRQFNAQLRPLEAELAAVAERVAEQMLLVPNIVSPDTPYGASEADNVEIERVGTPPVFDFEPKDHVALAEAMGMLDLGRGVKVAGSRGYFLKNSGLHLHRAVQQLAIDVLAERGFTVMDVPLLAREEVLRNTGFFPTGRSQTYELAHDKQWLVGTAEVPLVSYHANEIVDVTEPIRLAAVSNCFRREAGSAGRDVHGLYRVHQFAKVEQVVLCQSDLETSFRLFNELTQHAKDILELLELPYRVVSVCTGDLSQKNYKQVDLETWMPSRNQYGETHSSSMLLDFQARRSNIRYRNADGELRYCHTLNNTAIASPRILIPLLENHQREDGSVQVPRALRKYLGNITELRPSP